MEVWGRGGEVSRSLSLGPISVVSFIEKFFFMLGKEPSVRSEYNAGWSPDPVWRLCRAENVLPLLGTKPRFFDYPAH